MTEIWKQSPFIRITPFFFLGIWLGSFILTSSSFDKRYWVVLTMSLLLCTFVCCIVIHKKKLWNHRYLYGTSILICMWLCGVCFALINSPLLSSSHFVFQDHSKNEGYIIKILHTKSSENKVSGVAEILVGVDSVGYVPVCGKVRFYLDSNLSEVSQDAVLFVKSTISSISPARHPGAFDYQAFSERKGIFGSIYLKKNNWISLPELHKSSLQGTLSNFRDQQLARLNHYDIADRERAIIAALVLGKTDDLDPSVMQGYSTTGVIHVLAVSGLHVALVYMILAPIFKKLMPSKKHRWWRFLIPFCILWFYAALTGFSPSVLRSAVMFTLFLISEQFEESNHSLNTLFASALFLAAWDPSFLFDIGFLLSYLAVGGIMTMQRKLQLLWSPQNAILINMKEMITVSIAAQLLTLPLTLWLFGQFPTYFLIANLLIIPLSTVVLYAGLIFFLFGFFSPIDHLSLNISITFIQWMNGIIEYISLWPCALLKNIHVDFTQMLLLFVLLFLGWQLFFRRKKYALLLLPLGMFIFSTTSSKQGAPSCMISQVKKDIAIALTYEKELNVFYFSNDSIASQEMHDRLEKYYAGWMKHNRLQQLSFFPLSAEDLVSFGNKATTVSIHVLQQPAFSIQYADIVVLPAHLSKRKIWIPEGAPTPNWLLLSGYWSEKKRLFLQKRLKIPAHRIISLRNSDFIL